MKRSSENGALSACGSPFAIVCANTQPEPGVALKPPVPQPQLTYRPSTGVGPMIGDASGADVDDARPTSAARARRAKTGKSSSAAASWCSITCNEPRCAYEL